MMSDVYDLCVATTIPSTPMNCLISAQMPRGIGFMVLLNRRKLAQTGYVVSARSHQDGKPRIPTKAVCLQHPLSSNSWRVFPLYTLGSCRQQGDGSSHIVWSPRNLFSSSEMIYPRPWFQHRLHSTVPLSFKKKPHAGTQAPLRDSDFLDLVALGKAQSLT